ncbi:hypothetical protein [Gemmata sp.]|uniref:hypothetical protein n=1 Tax=Gemmata sp. TaxID=1914242 RepID=UPI003F724C93
MDVIDAGTFPRYPVAFEALAGMSPAAFSALVAEVRLALDDAEEARLDRPDRRRAPGGGRRPRLRVADRLLLTLIKARFRAGPEVGLMFGVGTDTTRRTTRRVLPLLLASSAGGVAVALAPRERRERFLRAVRCLPNDGGTVQLLGRACGLYIGVDGRVHPHNRVTAA